jgi:hypothetical protein
MRRVDMNKKVASALIISLEKLVFLIGHKLRTSCVDIVDSNGYDI